MIRVLIVHEVQWVCDALINVLHGESDIEVVGLASCTHDGLMQIQICNCDVILVNGSRSYEEVLRFIRESLQRSKVVKVLVFGMVEAKEFILQCFQAGAIGYTLRNESLSVLLHRIRAAMLGRTIIPPDIAGALVSRLAELSHFVSDMDSDKNLNLLSADLTIREQEVLQCIAMGYSNQNIAEVLTITVGTVKNHVHKILKKLNVTNRKHATLLVSERLFEPRIEQIEPAIIMPAFLEAYDVSGDFRRIEAYTVA